MRRSLSTGIIGCGAVLIFILAGCGGGSGSTSDGEISKANFLKQGNAICEKQNAAMEQALQQLSKGENKPSRAAQARFVSVTVVPDIEAEIAALESLSYPSQDEEAIETFLAEAENALHEVKKEPGILTNGAGPFASADKFASTYGLSACGFTAK
jgi:hypothetical protein